MFGEIEEFSYVGAIWGEKWNFVFVVSQFDLGTCALIFLGKVCQN